MKITPKWDFVEGSFDTKEVEMVCVRSDNQGTVSLSIQEKNSMSVGFAKIKLHSKDLYIDYKATADDAYAFGKEIARRWNECETKL